MSERVESGVLTGITGITEFAGGTDGRGPGIGRAFASLLWRDVFVTGREVFTFLAQTLIQPLFLLFVFGKVLGELGYTQGGYADVLFPGIVAMTTFITALQSTTIPLVVDFSYTKEIEDRLLAPLPIGLVAVEKMVFAGARALVAGVLVFPAGRLMLGPLPVGWSELPAVLAFLVLGALAGAAVGLVLGTVVKANKINVVFAVVLAPLMFTGSIQFPWQSLETMRWFQVICAVNPLTYVSEGMRGQMVPQMPHLSPALCVGLLVGIVCVFVYAGIRGFRRRALD